MYTIPNFKTKKALKEAVAQGQNVSVFQPNSLDHKDYGDFTGMVTAEGPHYPEPHRWYARLELKNGAVVKVS